MKIPQKVTIKKSNEVNYFKVDVQYPKNSHEPHNGLQFLPEMKNVGKVKKLVVNLQDKKEYITTIKIPKQALNHVLALKKKIIKFNQKAQLKSYIDENTELINK